MLGRWMQTAVSGVLGCTGAYRSPASAVHAARAGAPA